MKQARAGDFWRRLAEKRQLSHIESLQAVSIDGLPEEKITLQGPITVITGLNGVGKSTLLHAVHLLLRRGDIPKIEIAALRGCEGEFCGKVRLRESNLSLTTSLRSGNILAAPEETGLPVTWVDPSFDVPLLITDFRKEQNLEEALEQVSSTVATQDELSELSSLVGKSYERVVSYELEDFVGRAAVPYFKVTAAGREYGMEAMGLGEVSLHYLLWHMKRLPVQSIILIEEPETYVSSRSQSALMDLLARLCLTKSLSAIITTHSPHVFAKVPPEHTIILVKDGARTRVVVRDADEARLRALGIPPLAQKAGVLLVEDRMAREFAVLWLRRNNPELLRSWHLVDVGSSGHILTKLQHFPVMGDWFTAIGLFDGDERGKLHRANAKICFLPGEHAPEILLRKAILACQGEIARLLRKDVDIVRVAVSSIEGCDHHDWFLELARSLEVSFGALTEAAYDCWILDQSNLEQSRSALQDLMDTMQGE